MPANNQSRFRGGREGVRGNPQRLSPFVRSAASLGWAGLGVTSFAPETSKDSLLLLLAALAQACLGLPSPGWATAGPL